MHRDSKTNVNRRKFALAAALLPAFPLFAQNAARLYRIGTITSAWASNHPAVEGLRAGLKALGMVLPQSILIRADRVVE